MKNATDKEVNKVLMVFFSATGNTKKIADRIQQKLEGMEVKVTKYDITSYQERNKVLSLDEYDAIFFGFPIYSLRAPRVCREWLERQEGNDKLCSVFFTYGGFGKEPAHYYIKELLTERRFVLVSTAEFLGAHTFNYSGWQAAEGRPNQSDFEMTDDYAVQTLQKFRARDVKTVCDFEKVKYTSEQLDQAEQFRFHLIKQLPTRDDKACTMCMLCETLCPTNAMNALKGTADAEACIACFRCIANCPDSVLHTNDIAAAWENKLNMHQTTKKAIDQMKSQIFL
ncbi:MAG: hypothetical protein PWP51_2399 [Clostridiales bacterium]|nr:hypothetical protein [Clostridiales bacterium]MDN5299846.1 hypothetical protein [Clostridiales bacterium]